MEQIKKLVKNLVANENEFKIIESLQNINKLFLTKYILIINNGKEKLKICPVEVEAYYFNFKQDIVHDNMIHKDDRQRNHFGQLYFHRTKKSKRIIASYCNRGGVDVCISNSDDYFLSILIRSAYINGKLISGINRFIKEFHNIDYTRIESINQNIIFPKDNEKKYKIINQTRIVGKKYTKTDNYELNSLNIKEIHEIKHIFYTVKKKKDLN
jgi:hypothetical protein